MSKTLEEINIDDIITKIQNFYQEMIDKESNENVIYLLKESRDSRIAEIKRVKSEIDITKSKINISKELSKIGYPEYQEEFFTRGWW